MRPDRTTRCAVLFTAALFLAALLLPGGAALAQDVPSGKRLIDRIQDAYKDLETLQCTFVQSFNWALAGEGERHEGTIELKKRDKFRYESPSQIMVTDGETLWRYSVLNKQCIVEDLDQVEDSVLPRQILFEYPDKFEPKDVRVTSLNGRRTFALDLRAEDPAMGFTDVTVWIDAEDSITRKMQWEDESGNTTTYELQDVMLNVEIPDTRFTLDLPGDVKVFDLR